ncbi:MAG: tetratricopeptide repeat protein [Candidatus Sericytochromatia bacterium]
MTEKTNETLTDSTPESPDSESPRHPFELGLELYEQKAPFDHIIPLFEQGLNIAPRDSIGYTCLAWLHLLRNQEDDANKGMMYAQKAVRLDPNNAQANFNLVMAMLVNNTSGVRQEFQRAMSKLGTAEDRQEVVTNFQDALERWPALDAAKKILAWIQGA